jgi:hypothetical protein
VTPILDKIRSAGGRVVVLAGKVRIEVPPGLLTDQDREILARNRDELIEIVTRARARNPRGTVVGRDLWVVRVKRARSRWSAFFSPSPPQPRVREVRGRKMLL